MAIVAAFVAGVFVDSPWRDAAANAERQPLVTATVEERELTADAPVVEGRYLAGTTSELTTTGDAALPVVTSQLLEPGDDVTSGSVIAEISGRPVIALALPFMLYRDLAPGAEGADVRVVQDVLATLGHYDGAVDGKYGGQTSAAVDRLYAAAGYPAPSPGPDALAAVEAAEADLSQAPAAPSGEQDGERSTEAGDETPGGPSTVDVAAARVALSDAREAAGTPLPRSEIAQLADAATVLSVASVGTLLSDGASYLRVRTGMPAVTARVPVGAVDAFPVGASVTVYSVTDTSAAIDGVVSDVSEFRDPDSETIPNISGHDVSIRFDAQDLPFDEGDTMVLEPVEETEPLADGPAVPLLALREGPEGSYVLSPDGQQIPVDVVATGHGYAVVRGVDPGDTVVVSGNPDRDA
ncbi:peptidoglycan-binding protein [Paraoerskovia marina]|uniref:peptidoglycan-binding protein n=1 Tax=Paraoerskovia marina TaxID=545619 RepID=UPI0009F290A2|nr:peptidoglycan-binding protein [Paraoerskovia marina]